MPLEMPRACREIAAIQDGVLARSQALDNGMSASLITSLLRAGRWQAPWRGVYLVSTGIPSRLACLWAAVHRAGPDAALSHQTAAELFRLTSKTSPSIHITISQRRRVEPIPGVIIYRSTRFDELVHPSLQPPRTRIEETVLDLVNCAATFDDAFGLVCLASQRRLTTPARLCDTMSLRAKLRWRPELTEALGSISAGAHSVLEYRYLRRVERPHGLPAATRQARVDSDGRRRYLDNLYDDYKLCVELDGLSAHPDEQRWQDLRRINLITAQGITTLRYGWTDIFRSPCQTAVQVALVLRRLGWPAAPRRCGPACPVDQSAQ